MYNGQDIFAEKPVQLREFRNDSKDEIGRVGIVSNSRSPAFDTWGEASSSTRLNIAAVLVFLVSVTALLLSLLLVSGEIGEECGCPRDKGWSNETLRMPASLWNCPQFETLQVTV